MTREFTALTPHYNLAITPSAHDLDSSRAWAWSRALSEIGILPCWTLPAYNHMLGTKFVNDLAKAAPMSPTPPEGTTFAKLAEGRLRAVRAAQALLILNSGDSTVHLQNGTTAAVSHAIDRESENTIHLAVGMGKPIFLSDGYQETSYPTAMMHPDALEAMSVTPLDPQMSVEDRAEVIVRRLSQIPQPDPTEAMQ